MVFCQCHQKSFFSSFIDYIFQILFPRTDDCPLPDTRLTSFDSVYKTRFDPSPSYCDENVFRTAFSYLDTASAPLKHFDPDTFETSFTPTPCVTNDTFATDFYPEDRNMAFRRQACRKKEYQYDQKPFFNAISPSRGAFASPGIIQSIKDWYCGVRTPPPMPSIVTEPDDIDCNCPPPRGSRLMQLQRWLLCSPLPRTLLTLAAARAILYMFGVRVCFVKMV